MISNAICTSGSNLADIVYYQDNDGKYKFYGFRLYKTSDDEGSVLAEIDSLDDIIDNLQQVKKEIADFNKMGS